jgi:hypothetical protein
MSPTWLKFHVNPNKSNWTEHNSCAQI